jgi:hypothetical protein
VLVKTDTDSDGFFYWTSGEGNFGRIVPQNSSISNVGRFFLGDFSHDALAAMRFVFALMAGMIPSRRLH